MRGGPDPIPRTVEWRRGRIRIIDQRALPERLRFVNCATVDQVCDAISSMAVRGAPALGATGAFGVALAARTLPTARAVRASARRLAAARPTGVNLAWGVERALAAWQRGGAQGALEEAQRIAAADVEGNRAIGALGAPLVPRGARVLTHCNAGSLATVGYGTALGVIRAAAEAGKRPRVWVDETRPVFQGSRLTAWELERLGIDVTVLPDAMAGSLFANDEVDLVVVGADRIAANGDVVNKVGTYPLAVLARRHRVPFVVAAPTATIDLATATGEAAPIEERAAAEVIRVGEHRVAPAGVRALNRAFDVTPARLVTAIVTEQGVLRSPFRRSLRDAKRRAT
jgi:methylthioribose-1-phosphate isomerase